MSAEPTKPVEIGGITWDDFRMMLGEWPIPEQCARALVSHYGPLLMYNLVSRGMSQPDADCILQQYWEKLLGRLRDKKVTIGREAAFRRYLVRGGAMQVASYFRLAHRRRESASGGPTLDQWYASHDATEESWADLIDRAQLIKRLEQLAPELSEEEQDLLEAHVGRGQLSPESSQQVADWLNSQEKKTSQGKRWTDANVRQRRGKLWDKIRKQLWTAPNGAD